MDLAPGVPTDLSKEYRVPTSSLDGATNILGKDIQVGEDGTLYVELALAAGAVSTILRVNRDGTPFQLNNGVALNAGNVYAFELTIQAEERVNFSVALATTLGYIRILYRRWV